MGRIGEVQILAPQRLEMSYQEYFDSASESKITEWTEGEVITYMPPVFAHQNIVGFLDGLLRFFIQFFGLGVVIPAPFEVKLWPDGPSREPDLVFIANENLSRLTLKRFEGGPDLIIEVISPSSITEDRARKFIEYERAGVREYWLIDPRPRQQQMDFYVLGSDQAYHSGPVDDDGIYHSSVIPNFWFNVDWLRQKELPNPQLILAEIMLSVAELPAEAKEAYQAMYRLLDGKSGDNGQ